MRVVAVSYLAGARLPDGEQMTHAMDREARSRRAVTRIKVFYTPRQAQL